MMTSSFPDWCHSDSPLGFNTVYRHWEETWLNKWKTNSETIHLLTKCSRGWFPWLVWVNQCNLNLIFMIKYRTTIQCVWKAAGSMKNTSLKIIYYVLHRNKSCYKYYSKAAVIKLWYILIFSCFFHPVGNWRKSKSCLTFKRTAYQSQTFVKIYAYTYVCVHRYCCTP